MLRAHHRGCAHDDRAHDCREWRLRDRAHVRRVGGTLNGPRRRDTFYENDEYSYYLFWASLYTLLISSTAFCV